MESWIDLTVMMVVVMVDDHECTAERWLDGWMIGEERRG